MSDGVNPFAKQFQLGQQPQSPLPTPDMKQATSPMKSNPSPFPQSGFAKQGVVQGQSKIPTPTDGGL